LVRRGLISDLSSITAPHNANGGQLLPFAGSGSAYNLAEFPIARAVFASSTCEFLQPNMTLRMQVPLFGGGKLFSKKIRIVLADDQPITLRGLRMLIQEEPDFELVAEATSGTQALEAILALKPDVAIVDISLPRMNGIVLARRVAQECPNVGVIALTSHED